MVLIPSGLQVVILGAGSLGFNDFHGISLREQLRHQIAFGLGKRQQPNKVNAIKPLKRKNRRMEPIFQNCYYM